MPVLYKALNGEHIFSSHKIDLDDITILFVLPIV